MLRNRTLKIAKTVLSMISCIIKLPENGRFLNDILEFYPVNIHKKSLYIHVVMFVEILILYLEPI